MVQKPTQLLYSGNMKTLTQLFLDSLERRCYSGVNRRLTMTNTPVANCQGDMGVVHFMDTSEDTWKCVARVKYDFNTSGIAVTVYPEGSMDALLNIKLGSSEVSRLEEVIRCLLGYLPKGTD